MTILHTLTKWHMPNLQDPDKMAYKKAAGIERHPRNQPLFLFTEVSLTAGALLAQEFKGSHNRKNDRAKKFGTQLAL
jgi:hypothetical protein